MVVLLVEDNDMIARLVARVLELEPDVTLRSGGSDVTVLMDEALWRDVDVALVDLLLPGATGDELLSWLAEHAPRVRRVAMSGSGEQRLQAAPHADARLLKPFHADELITALRP